MDKMNILSVLTVSVPENILNILIGMLIIGYKDKIKINNLPRILITTILMVADTYIIRANVPIGLASIACILVTYIPIMWLGMGINKYAAIISSVFSVGFIVGVEEAYLLPCIVFMQKNLPSIYSDSTLRLLFSIPGRVLQGLMVVSLWNWNVALINLKKYKEIRVESTIVIVSLILLEMLVPYNIVHSTHELSLASMMVFIATNILFTILNFYMFKFITKYSATIVLTVHKKYEKHVGKVSEILYNLNIKEKLENKGKDDKQQDNNKKTG